jgi:hypothetical protein
MSKQFDLFRALLLQIFFRVRSERMLTQPLGGLRKIELRGLEKVGWLFRYAAAAYNLWRIPKLQASAAWRRPSAGPRRPLFHQAPQ